MTNPRIDGINWKALKKGDIISHLEIVDYWKICFKDKDWDDRYSIQRIKEKIEQQREEIDQPIILRETKGELKVLNDKEAIEYSASQANAGIKKHRKHTRRLFTHIDKRELDESEQRNLETKQIHHAFIEASADGARKHSLQLQRKGERLPKSLIEKSNLRVSDP